MEPLTRKLWDKQNVHDGDRWRLFQTVGQHLAVDTVLYPGSYVDIAPSFVFPSVTYVDVDRRARAFFQDHEGVMELIREHPGSPDRPTVEFRCADYTDDLGLVPGSYDLLISLYAGFVSDACTNALRVGGTLLVNGSHGDAALASIDPRYELAGVVTADRQRYRITNSGLDAYLVPRSGRPVTRAELYESRRGIAYTKPAFAYLFTRIG